MATEMNEMSTGGAQGIHRRKLQPGVPVIKVINYSYNVENQM